MNRENYELHKEDEDWKPSEQEYIKKEHWTKKFDDLWETLDGIDGAYDYRDEIKVFFWKLIKSNELN